MIRIEDSNIQPEKVLHQMAHMLVEGFREHWSSAWETFEEALQQVREILGEDQISLVALNENGEAVGWIGGLPEYDGNVWELHPLVVRVDQQGRGVGRELVLALEAEVARRGGLTMRVGTDDEDYMTSLSQVDIYDGLLDHLRDIRNIKRHPFEFYQKLGYQIIGVIPDANGRFKPDILMGKRIEPVKDN